MKKLVVAVVIISMLAALTGCGMKKRDQGVLIGAAAGAVVGGVIGDKAGNTAAGAIIGAAVGGAAGAYIGNYMDKQAAEMEKDLEGATIERIGEGIKITFESGILFQINKSELQMDAKTNIENLAVILNKYEDTEILIEGHTDSTGSEEYNMTLSINRAQSVANFLQTNQVMPTRLNVMGYGESQPVADNATASGRQLNRRVEIAIFANDKLKKTAENKVEG